MKNFPLLCMAFFLLGFSGSAFGADTSITKAQRKLLSLMARDMNSAEKDFYKCEDGFK